MNYEAIKAEIAKPVYAGQTNVQIAATLDAMTVPGPTQAVAIIDVMGYLRDNNLWMSIKAAAASNAAAAAAVDLNEDPRATTIDMSQPVVQGMLASLVSASLLTQAQSNAILAMANPPVPAFKVPGETVSADSIAFARGLSS